MNQHHREEKKAKAFEKLAEAEKCANRINDIVKILIPQVYGQSSDPIKCEIPSFQTVDNARIGLNGIYRMIGWLRGFVKNLLEPGPETYNLKNRTVKMLLNAVNASMQAPMALSERMALEKEFEQILQNTLQDQIEELRRHINGMCECCGGMGRVPYGSGIPDGEDYDLCPVCNWEKIADVLKGKIKRIDIKA